MSPSVEVGVNDSIAQTFPDANFAQVVANEVAGGNVNAILTQTMVDNCIALHGGNKNIQDITGVNVLSNLEILYLYSTS